MHVSCQYSSLYNLMSIPASDGASQVVVHGPPPRTITLRTLRTGHSTHNFEISGCRTHAYHSNTTTSAWSSKHISKGTAEDTYICLKNPLISRFSLQKTIKKPIHFLPCRSTLEFQVVVPTAAHFVNQFVKANCCENPRHAEAGSRTPGWTLAWPGRGSSPTAGMGIEKYDYPPVNEHSYWKWPFIVDLPIKNGGFQ